MWDPEENLYIGVKFERRTTSLDGRAGLISTCVVAAWHVEQRVWSNRIIRIY